MKKTITKMLGLALGVFSLTASAQCPTISQLSVSSTSLGTTNISVVVTGSLSGTAHLIASVATGDYHLGNNTTGAFPTPNSNSALYVYYVDSILNCTSNILTDTLIVVGGTTTATSCPTITSLSITYGANGMVNVTANYIGTLSGTGHFTPSAGGTMGAPNSYISFPYSNSGSLWFANNGNGNMCIAYNDNGNNCYSAKCDSIIITNATGSGTGTTTPVPCSVNANFSIYADSVNAGNYFAYNNTIGSGALTYLWNFGDGSTSTQAYPFHQYTSVGVYTICLTATSTDSTGNCTDTYCMAAGFKVSSSALMGSLTVKPSLTTGVKENNTIVASLNAYPNPMNDELTIEVALNNNSTVLVYTIVDALGKVVAQNKILDSKTTINTAQLEKGFYFLSISNEKGSFVKSAKLVK